MNTCVFKANISLCWHTIHIWWQSVHHVLYSVCIRWVWECVLTFLRGEFQFSYLFSQHLIASFKFIWFHDSGHLPWAFSELWWKMRDESSGEACSIRKEIVRELVMLWRHEMSCCGGGLEGTLVWMRGRQALKRAKQPWLYNGQRSCNWTAQGQCDILQNEVWADRSVSIQVLCTHPKTAKWYLILHL